VRGDGNCYYRSFVYQYLEILFLECDSKPLKHLLHWIESGLDYYIFDDNMEPMGGSHKGTLIAAIKALIYL
jgi:hypothetical protein